VLDDLAAATALASLERFPLAAVKIDRLFISAIQYASDDAPIGRAVIGQPAQMIDVPYLPARVQQIEITEAGEDGTLRAFIRVDFAPRTPSGYYSKTSVRLLARR
jgi:hypothetical protein